MAVEFEQDPLPSIDERWFLEFVNLGITELEARLRKQAAFDEWCDEQKRKAD